MCIYNYPKQPNKEHIKYHTHVVSQLDDIEFHLRALGKQECFNGTKSFKQKRYTNMHEETDHAEYQRRPKVNKVVRCKSKNCTPLSQKHTNCSRLFQNAQLRTSPRPHPDIITPLHKLPPSTSFLHPFWLSISFFWNYSSFQTMRGSGEGVEGPGGWVLHFERKKNDGMKN